MGKKFIVFTEMGRSDSLAQSVRIVFTLTPCPSQFRKDAPYHPIAQMVMEFRANDEQSQTYKWDTELGFSLWSRKTEHSIDVDSYHCTVPPTHYVELRSSPQNEPPRWSRTQVCNDDVCRKELFVTAVNRTNKNQRFTLGCIKQTFDRINFGFQSFEPLVCYNIPPGYSAFAPSNLMLQAYVVNGVKSKRNQLLLDEDLRHPIFSSPIHCDTLPKTSTWRLCRDNKGAISLTNLDKNEFDLLAAQSQIERIAASLGTAEAKLSKVDQRLYSLEIDQKEALAQEVFVPHPLEPVAEILSLPGVDPDQVRVTQPPPRRVRRFF